MKWVPDDMKIIYMIIEKITGDKFNMFLTHFFEFSIYHDVVSFIFIDIQVFLPNKCPIFSCLI